MNISDSISTISGVGPKRSRILESIGITTLEDILTFWPVRYLARGEITQIEELEPAAPMEITGRISNIRHQRPRRSRIRSIVRARLTDDSGEIDVLWFNQPYIANSLADNDFIWVRGRLKEDDRGRRFIAESWESFGADEATEEQLRQIVPVYREIKGVGQKSIRKMIELVLKGCLQKVEELWPEEAVELLNLMNRRLAVSQVHSPADMEEFEAARSRLKWDELLLMQLMLCSRRHKVSGSKKNRKYNNDSRLNDEIMDAFPFRFTGAQERSLDEVRTDIVGDHPMQRLLQGDVGSGKTAVAMAAAAFVCRNGYQCAFMVPTEVLAVQHEKKLRIFLEKLNLKSGLLLGSTKKADRVKILEALSAGDIDIVFGTQALFQTGVEYKNLGLVIIDEQHRFGVAQRARLVSKGDTPDLLVMTATPIPRTMALAVYGDLDISIIDEIPPGRTPPKTILLQGKRAQMNSMIHKAVKTGGQVFIIYPIIESSDKVEWKSAMQMYDHLSRRVFRDCRCDLVHGRMDTEEKTGVMERFSAGEIDILISTTVIEVGIDIPNASLMVIEEAHRFGLAQLHQLRGRVGRGTRASSCILHVDRGTAPESLERLKVIAATNDGFQLAEEDLKLRGPGDLLGQSQSGFLNFSFADIMADTELLYKAQQTARDIWKKFIQEKPNRPPPWLGIVRKMERLDEQWAP